jgi:hypothetical protein
MDREIRAVHSCATYSASCDSGFDHIADSRPPPPIAAALVQRQLYRQLYEYSDAGHAWCAPYRSPSSK